MKIKRDEIDAAIAVEVMPQGAFIFEGKVRDRVVVGDYADFRPSTDANHALEAAMHLIDDWKLMCIHLTKNGCNMEICLPDLPEIDSRVNGEFHINPATAICLALLSAVRGESVELEDEA